MAQHSTKHAQSPADLYLARLDSQLPQLADDRARRALLHKLSTGWEARYARFQVWAAKDGRSEIFEGFKPTPTAFDFLEIISGVTGRRQLIDRPMVAA